MKINNLTKITLKFCSCYDWNNIEALPINFNFGQALLTFVIKEPNDNIIEERTITQKEFNIKAFAPKVLKSDYTKKRKRSI